MTKKRLSFVIRKRNQSWPRDELPAFILQPDNWNDFGFQTLYHLSYATLQDGRVVEDPIGAVKILRSGQTPSDGLQLRAPFSSLGDDFCSVGVSLDYYNRLRRLPKSMRSTVLRGLRDVVDNRDIESTFKDEDGWLTSLFRDTNVSRHLQLATGLLTGDFSHLPDANLTLSFSLPGWQKSLNFDFGNALSGSASRILPTRVEVLVGKNGSGKSTALARLARVALGTVEEREGEVLSSLGEIHPKGIGFPRVISVSFSAFDSFRLPGNSRKTRKKVANELSESSGRFAFIGLRDIAAEADDTTNWPESGVALLGDRDRLPLSRLKSVDKLCEEFLTYVKQTRERGRTEVLNDSAKALLTQSAFDPHLDGGLAAATKSQLARAFLECSTGHKIAALVMTGLIATLEPLSLVLFDEPESHLHPPLLSSLMHTLRKILRDQDSYCVIATHSPVVLQESMASNVQVVARYGDVISIDPPTMETFGESIGLITSEVFGLNSESTDFHALIDKLTNRYKHNSEIDKLFLNERMSHQARAYVMSSRARSGD